MNSDMGFNDSVSTKANNGLRAEGSNCPSWFSPFLTITVYYRKRILSIIIPMIILTIMFGSA